ncbi:major facilitator superfamily transporter [Pseudomassariella vexata]|uniref:Major facilitator superfamily transporter n=1 Tax=Pseudomassariella vexata TaxID=1141098 RepID=A0A1Y2DI02_9PEZI|nr:major facilitator superfamily transporter [Pseudomassariella vexata]ORY58860.1 major facilitator superfamily transporter [Pseudomassariella vexata]
MDLSGSVFLISSDGQMLSLPIPSDSPNDPLGWSSRKRMLAFASVMLYDVVGVAAIQAPTFMYGAFDHDAALAERSLFRIEVLVSAPMLMLGIGAFLWVPLSLAIGRRPVFLLCTLMTFISTISAALAQNFYQLLAAMCVQGLAASSILSLLLCIVIDMTFIHERPQAIAMFWGLGGSLTLLVLSIIPQIKVVDTDWRSFYWIWSMASLASFVMTLFCFPETFFLRPPVAWDGRIVVQSGSEKVRIYDDWDAVPGEQALPNPPDKHWFKRFIQRIKVWSGRSEWKAMWACYPQVILCLCNPLVFWVMLLNAVNFAGMVSIGESFVYVLAAKPYNFPPWAVALVNLAAAVGSFLVWPAAGIMIQNITRHLTRRNGGVRHAEYYLPAFVLPVLAGAAGNLLFGLTAQYHLHWILIYISYALKSFSFVALGAANVLWVTESFPQWSAAALVCVGGFSYIVSFSMSFVLPLWIKSQGYAWENIQLAIMILVVGGVGVPVAFWGKNVRQYLDGRWGEYQAGALRPQ